MVGAPSFNSPEYWESRFQNNPSAFEWLLSPNCLDKHVLEALAAASSHFPDSSSPSRPSLSPPPRLCIHHIGCGTSAMSFQLRRLVDDPAQVHNTDYSPAAVVIGRRREREMFGDEGWGGETTTSRCTSASTGYPLSESDHEGQKGDQTSVDVQRRRDQVVSRGSSDRSSLDGVAGTKRRTMGWSTIDLLSLSGTAPLAQDSYAVIVDKSTSDCISCVDDVPVTLPYALQPVETADSTTKQAPTTAEIHPLHLLAVHLAHHTQPGGRWLVVSYSGARFPFLPPYPKRVDEGLLEDETVQRGFVHPGRLWRLERHEMIDSEEEQG